MNPVIFAGDKRAKHQNQWLEKKNIKVFYGDSDNDITAAQDVEPEGSGCYAPLTRPIDRCRWPESLVKR
jgi:acid phosphatase class B